MATYQVTVERKILQYALIEVEADSLEAAERLVEDRIEAEAEGYTEADQTWQGELSVGLQGVAPTHRRRA
jgi:hypothetical protein